jgi:hypothetical protein
MTVKPPAPPPLPDELDRVLRRLRLPYVRRAAPEVIANATAQRWEYAEVLRVLLAEEPPVAIRRRSGCAAVRPGCRLARRSTRRSPTAAQSRSRRSARCERWSGSTAQRCFAYVGQAGPARATSSKRSAISRSTRARPSPGTRLRRSRNSSAAWHVAEAPARLGHSSVATTLRIYAHQFDAANRSADRRAPPHRALRRQKQRRERSGVGTPTIRRPTNFVLMALLAGPHSVVPPLACGRAAFLSLTACDRLASARRARIVAAAD